MHLVYLIHVLILCNDVIIDTNGSYLVLLSTTPSVQILYELNLTWEWKTGNVAQEEGVESGNEENGPKKIRLCVVNLNKNDPYYEMVMKKVTRKFYDKVEQFSFSWDLRFDFLCAYFPLKTCLVIMFIRLS